jgi:flagellar hook-associated protein 1 FlgK
MSLSSALSIAQSSLLATSRQTTVVSRNVADASNPDYSRRIASIVSTAPGAHSVDIQRVTNEALFRQNLSALSAWAGQHALYGGLDELKLAVNGVENASSASTAIGALQQALQLYATTPSNRNLANSVIDAARRVVRSLNDGSKAIQNFRVRTDSQIATAVGELNALLGKFQEVNIAIVSGSQSGNDVSDALDQRDALLKKISEYVPISTFTRGANDMVITTADGTTLFETIPRTVSFTPNISYAAGMAGNAIYIDNVPLAAGTGGDTTAGGMLAGLLQLRDGVASTMQSQLDEIARGLIDAFAETSPTLPAAAGLFTWSGAPGIPPAGTLVHGLAGQISLHAAMDPDAGGDPTLLRDGGANGAGYVANVGGGASFTELLIAYGDRLDQPTTFDPQAGITGSFGVAAYANNAIGWFEGVRQQAASAVEAKEALAMRTAEALSNATGVNVDQELSLLLDLEHTYQASARILNSVNQMLDALMAAVR